MIAPGKQKKEAKDRSTSREKLAGEVSKDNSCAI